MLGIPAAVKWAMILGLVVTTISTAWGVVSYIEKSAIVELQRDQLAAAIKARDEARREVARYQAAYLALKPDRLRLCVVHGPQSGCCKPEPEECRP